MLAVLTTSLPSIAADARLARLQWHFENRSRLEFRNYADFGLGADTHADFIRTRVGVEYRLTDKLRVSALGQDARAPFLGRTAPGNMRDPFDLQEGYLEYGGEAKRGLYLDLGRRMVQYGDTRLIGAPQWAYTARTYDLARAAWRTGRARYELLLISPIKPVGNGFNKPVLGDRVIGTYNTFTSGQRTLDVYVLRHDQNRPGGWTGAGRLRTESFGFRIVWPWPGGMRTTVEAVGQTGRVGGLPHRAGAWVAQWGRSMKLGARQLELSAEAKYASGTNRPDRSGTFDQIYPAAHDKLGHIDVLGWRNNRNVKLVATYSLTKWLTLTAMYDDTWLAVETDAAYNSGGRAFARSADGSAGTHLGREADIYLQGKRGRVAFGAGYGRFFTGEFLRKTTPGIHQHLGYLFYTYGF